MNKESNHKSSLSGNVTSISNGTARVRIARQKVHPIYNKRYTAHTVVLASLPEGKEIEKGQDVKVIQTKPQSKRKSWQIV